MSRRPLGAFIDVADERDGQFGPSRFFADTDEPKASFSPQKPISYETILDKIPDQIGQSCVGHALCTAVYVHGKLHGSTAPRGSSPGLASLRRR